MTQYHNTLDIRDDYVDKVFGACASSSEYRKKTFQQELNCLQLLEERFINAPAIDHYPFPKIISIDEENCTVRMTNCGLNLKQIKGAPHRPSPPNNFCHDYLIRTINCIVNNLKNLTLIHHNIHERQFLINSKGHLHLIDFEDSQPKNETYKIRKPEKYKLVMERIDNYTEQFKTLIFSYVT